MNKIINELKHHLPFTVLAGVGGIIIIALLSVVMTAVLEDVEDESTENDKQENKDEHEHHGVGELGKYFYDLFHIFHPFHVLFSATATSAMFWRFEKKLWKAILIGLIGSLAICGVSDIFLPYIGGILVGMDMDIHICLTEHSSVVVPFAFVGIILGLLSSEAFTSRKSTLFSHSAHVIISTMASILYLVTFGFTDWMHDVFIVFSIVILAVFIPCCFSDIIFPLLFTNGKDQRPESMCCGEGDHV